MRNKITVYNKEILKTLKEQYPQKWEQIKSKTKNKWLIGDDHPTYKQLVEISKIFNVPFGYLFLEQLPEKKLPISHFRTINDTFYEPSENLIDIIKQIQKQQEWVKDILIDWGHDPLPFAGKYTVNSTKEEIIKEIRSLLQLEHNWASLKTSWTEAFRLLVEKFEEIGIFVVISGIVGNNTHRKISIEECRGFVLYDDTAPFVFINNNDFISAKIFTLLHELIHILIGKSASFDLRNLQSSDNEIEKFCDRCAAEFLVPESEIKDLNVANINFEQLAKKYRVSQIVIARRLLDVGKINKEDFYKFYNHYVKQEKRKAKTKGGDFYNNVNYRYGKRFLEIMSTALRNNEILYRDAYRVLSLKPTTTEKILKISNVYE